MKHWFNRSVAGAGISSALGDVGYETTTLLRPGFPAVWDVPAAALGLIEGAAAERGGACPVRDFIVI